MTRIDKKVRGKEAATNGFVNRIGRLGNKVTIKLCRKKMIPDS